MKQWIENKCLSLIASSFDLYSFTISIEASEDASETNQLELFNDHFKEAQQHKFNYQFNFDRFIIGNNNRFAYAAAEAVAKRPAKAYNPLYIYGTVGVGKTHLLHAIANETSKQNLNVCLVTSERFTNDLINSIKNRSTNSFKKRYRSIDVCSR